MRRTFSRRLSLWTTNFANSTSQQTDDNRSVCVVRIVYTIYIILYRRGLSALSILCEGGNAKACSPRMGRRNRHLRLFCVYASNLITLVKASSGCLLAAKKTMKKFLLLALTLFALQFARAEQTVITLTEAGTLSQHISDAQKYSITDLKIVGPINGYDVEVVWDMLNISGWEHSYHADGNGKLTSLDLSEAKIMAGGPKKLDLDLNEDEIKESMFENCQSLKSIILPESLVAIGGIAFSRTGLVSFTIPENVTTIGDAVLRWCNDLTTLYIYTKALPSTRYGGVGWLALDCPALQKVVLGKEVEKFCPDSFSDRNFTVVVEEGNPYIVDEDGVLYDKDKTTLMYYSRSKTDTEFTVPETVKYIRSYTIGNDYLETVTIGMQVIVDGSNDFLLARCPRLKTIIWDNESRPTPSNISEDISWYYNYKRYPDIYPPYPGEDIPQIVIGKHVKDISNYLRASSIFNVVDDNPYICSVDGVLFSKDMTQLLIFPYGLEVSTYRVPEQVRIIGEDAFYDNYYYSSCHTVYLHKDIEKIEWYAFRGAYLKDLYVNAETPLVSTSSAGFAIDICYNYENVTLHVPEGSLEAYKNTEPWSNFYNIVEFNAAGINGMEQDAPTVTARFGLDGMKRSSQAKGLSIVRMSDGSTKKVFTK